MISELCILYEDCIRFQLAMFKIFIEPEPRLNLKCVAYLEILIRWNRWEKITRLLKRDVSSNSPSAHL